MQEKALAVAGRDVVKLFDEAGTIAGRVDPLHSQFSPSPGIQINAIRWNHTNHVLASAGEDKKVSLWLNGGKLLGSVPQEIHTADALDELILSINFSSKSSRYLCSGGTGKIVRIWDMQRRRCIKWLKGHTDTITGVMYNCKDEHLASISTRGDLIIYSLASGSRVTEVKDPGNQVLRVLEYSRTSRHLLLTAGDDGSVHLWDTTGRTPKMSWARQHLAPTSGACFASSNDKVIVSVGLDKRLHAYDVGLKRPVQSISCEAPLTSLAVKDDGWTLAAGANNGRVLLYDTRKGVQPLANLRAFSPPEAVSSISWQHSSPVSISNATWSPDVALLGSFPGDVPTLLPDPLPRALAFEAKKESADRKMWSGSGSFIPNSMRNPTNSFDDMDIFSPIEDVQPIVQPLSSYMDELKLHPVALDVGTAKDSPAPVSELDVPRGELTSRYSKPFVSSYVELERYKSVSSGPSSPTSVTNAPKEMEDGAVTGVCSPGGLGSKATGPSSSFALHLVQRALEESLGSVQRAIHEDVRNLHVELLRQFHVQHVEMSSCFQKLVAKQDELMEEIQTLRKENEELRRYING